MHARPILRRTAAATTVTALTTLGALAPVYADDGDSGEAAPAAEASAHAGGPSENAAEAAFEATGETGGGSTGDESEDSADESEAASSDGDTGGPPENHTTGPDHSRGNASTRGTVPSPQPESNADENDGGANAYDCEDGPEGPYCATTRHESRNGLGDGEAVGRPAAGSVGRADNKKDNDVLLLTGAGLATIGGLLLTRRRPGRAGAHVRRD